MGADGAGELRRFSRGIFRGYVLELERSGQLASIRPRLSTATARAVDAGNSAPRWIEGSIIDDLLCNVSAQVGRDAVRELGYRALRDGVVGRVLQPLFSVVHLLSFRNPAVFFARADSMASVVLQGTRLEWTPKGGDLGVMTLRSDEPSPDASWAAWEGALSYGFDLTGTTGSIGVARSTDGGLSSEIAVTWSRAERELR